MSRSRNRRPFFAPNRLPRPSSRPDPHPSGFRWLERVELFCACWWVSIGLWLIFAPWTQRIWDQNPLFLHYSSLGHIAVNGAVRGLIQDWEF